MQVSIQDRDALLAISPAALSAYARCAGWSRGDSYREHSEIYVGEALPEIVLPLNTSLGDYASAVVALIETFAQVADQDALTVYRALTTADRDAIRVRAAESDEGSLGLNDGVALIEGASAMVLAAACSLQDPRPVYRAGANREAADMLQQMRLGQTEQGSFVVTLLTPPVPPPMSTLFDDEATGDHNAPIFRRMTKRLVEALAAVRRAAERAGSGDGSAFAESVASGVSANLCEALIKIIAPFPRLDISVLWARTRPVKRASPPVSWFGLADVALLDEAARSLRERAPKPDMHLHGFIRILERTEEEADGTIRFRAEVDGKWQSVAAVLEQADYERAVQAHKDRAPVILKGDLERTGQRWKLLNPQLESVLRDDEEDPEYG